MTATFVLTVVSAISALGAVVTGLRAVWLWREASRVQIDPGWSFERPEPVIHELRQITWTAAIIEASQKSGAQNAKAAKWTAWAVGCTALQSVAGFLASALA